jgi:hypothetical protein
MVYKIKSWTFRMFATSIEVVAKIYKQHSNRGSKVIDYFLHVDITLMGRYKRGLYDGVISGKNGKVYRREKTTAGL